VARLLAGPVEDSRDRLIRHLTRQYRHELNYVGVGAPAMLAGAVLANPESGMVAALPTDNEIEGVVLDTGNDLFDQCPDDPLAGR